MISRLTVKAALVGFAASVALAAPAMAATELTLDAQTEVVRGHSRATLTGTAEPGSTVTLWETAFVFDDLQPAKNWEVDNGPVTAVANPQGRWSIQRFLDSGFYFQVHSGGKTSEKRKFSVTQLPTFDKAASPSNNTVTVEILANPGQPGLRAELQKNIGGTWTKVGEGITAEGNAEGVGGGKATITATGVSGGTGTFRAYVNGDTANAVLPGASASTFTLAVGGPVTDPNTPTPTPTTTTPTPTPTTTTPTPKPTTTTPTPKPTTPKPTTPAPKPTLPAVGSVQFTKIQYDAPGKESGSNGSLNTEWIKLTNKSKSRVNLNGWYVRDVANHVYKFNGNVYLNPGASIFVLSGKGTNTAVKRYWGRKGAGGYIWNNAGDTAWLRTPTGRTIDSCKWSGVGRGYTMC